MKQSKLMKSLIIRSKIKTLKKNIKAGDSPFVQWEKKCQIKLLNQNPSVLRLWIPLTLLMGAINTPPRRKKSLIEISDKPTLITPIELP